MKMSRRPGGSTNDDMRKIEKGTKLVAPDESAETKGKTRGGCCG